MDVAILVIVCLLLALDILAVFAFNKRRRTEAAHRIADRMLARGIAEEIGDRLYARAEHH